MVLRFLSPAGRGPAGCRGEGDDARQQPHERGGRARPLIRPSLPPSPRGEKGTKDCVRKRRRRQFSLRRDAAAVSIGRPNTGCGNRQRCARPAGDQCVQLNTGRWPWPGPGRAPHAPPWPLGPPLPGACGAGATLPGACAVGATLLGATATGAILLGAWAAGATLLGATAAGAPLPGAYGACALGAPLPGAYGAARWEHPCQVHTALARWEHPCQEHTALARWEHPCREHTALARWEHPCQVHTALAALGAPLPGA